MNASDIPLIINALLRTEAKGHNTSVFSNKYEKYFFYLMFGLFLLLAITATAYHIFQYPLLRLIGILIALAFYLVAALWQLAMVIPIISFFRSPTKNFLREIEKVTLDEAASLISLGSIEEESIKYMQKRLELAQEQLSQRTAALIGAVEKVGILPGLLSALVTLYELNGGKLFESVDIGIYENITIVLVAFYTFYLVSVFIGQRLKIYSLILAHSAEYSS